MKLRQAIAAGAVIVGCALGSATTAGADTPAMTNDQALHYIFALTHVGGDQRPFWQALFALQNDPYTCTAYHSNIVGDGEGGGISPVVNTPIYEGNCAQAWLLVLDNAATFFVSNGNPDA